MFEKRKTERDRSAPHRKHPSLASRRQALKTVASRCLSLRRTRELEKLAEARKSEDNTCRSHRGEVSVRTYLLKSDDTCRDIFFAFLVFSNSRETNLLSLYALMREKPQPIGVYPLSRCQKTLPSGVQWGKIIIHSATHSAML